MSIQPVQEKASSNLESLGPTASDHEAINTAKLLVVDGNAEHRLAIRTMLGSLALDIHDAASALQAIESCQSNDYAAVLLDASMPDTDGFKLAYELRRAVGTRQLPILFMAEASLGNDQLIQGYELGAVDFLYRPILPEAIQAKVATFVGLYREREQAHRESEQFRLIVQGTTDYAIFMLDPHGRIATWNPGAARLKGYDAAEIVGQHFSRFYPQEAIDRGWPEHELQVAQRVGRFEDEGWRIRKDGSQFWANVIITALWDSDGVLRGFSKVTRDLTARKRTEESLRRSEERFRLLVESVKDYAIFQLDPHGVIVSWNAGAERIKGYAAEDIIGKHFAKSYPQEAIDRGWPEHELEVAKAEGRFEDEGWRLKKDGSRFWANVVITALRNAQGTLVGFSKITRDMTDRRNAEENLRRLMEEAVARKNAEESFRLLEQEQERLRVTLNSIGDAVITTDAEGIVQFMNPVAEDLVGWDSQQAAGRSLSEVFNVVNESSRQPVENPALRALRDGVIVGLANHTVLIARNGVERPISDSAAPIRLQSGELIGSILVFRDVTEQKQAEAELRDLAAALSHASRRKDEFLATLAHELRNPLAPMRTALQLIRMSDNAESIEHAHTVIDRQLNQMVRLVDDLLDLSRITQDKLELRKEKVSLQYVLNQAIETSLPLIEQMGHALNLDVPDQQLMVSADVTRMAQVFANLLNNAAKYSLPHGRIDVQVAEQGDELSIHVKDQGIGIARDQTPRIFEMFAQVDQSLERSQGGLGIGLTLVKKLVEMHEGAVEVHSDGLGTGAEFIVRLPLSKGLDLPNQSFESPRAAATRLRILVVDDNQDGAQTLALLLNATGNETQIAFDGQAGVFLAEQFSPDVILFDIGLPKLNGYEACRVIRQQDWGKQTTIVAITGWGQDEDRRKSREAGFDYHLVKPVDPAALLELLANVRPKARRGG